MHVQSIIQAFIYIYSVVLNDFVSRQWRPCSDCRCAGWSRPSLSVYAWCMFLHDLALMIIVLKFHIPAFAKKNQRVHTVCTLPSDMPVQLAIFLTDSRASYSTIIFTAAMLALVTEGSGLPGQVSSSTENFPALKSLTHLKTVRIEMVWGPYFPHNSLNICFESILSLMRHLI